MAVSFILSILLLIVLVILLVWFVIENVLFYRSVKNLSTAGKVLKHAETVTGFHLPIRLRAWDGSETGPQDAPVFHVKKRSVVRWLVWSPRFLSLGLLRALVDGNDLELDGDPYDLCQRVNVSGLALIECSFSKRIKWARNFSKTIFVVVSVFGWSLLCLPPPIPPQEFRPKSKKFTRNANKDACNYAYNYSFFQLMLDQNMVYSCAYYETPDMSLEEAQLAKLDLVCRKLGLKEGMTVLDIGCGWGSFLIHAAQKYGVTGKGITLSTEQCKHAQERVKRLGLEKMVDIQLMDFRDLKEVEHYDAVASIGMIEHIGVKEHRRFVQIVYKVLRPGGKLLLHTICRGFKQEKMKSLTTPFENHPAIERYFFPSCGLDYVHGLNKSLDEAGLEVRGVEIIRPNYVRTLRDWIKNLEKNEEEILKEGMSPGFLRGFKLGFAVAAHAFHVGLIGCVQLLSTKESEEDSQSRKERNGQERASSSTFIV